jgi:hypothetical protein
MKQNSNITLEVLSPVAKKVAISIQAAERPASLSNRTIGLVWNGKPGGDVAMKHLAELLKKHFNTVHSKEFFYGQFPFAKSQLEQIQAECDVIMGATGD